MTTQPLDLLNEIHAMLVALTARTALLETNLAILNDKANGHLFPDVKFQAGRQGPSAPPKIISPNLMRDLAADKKVAGVPLDKPAENHTGPARVFGTVYSPDKKPLH